MMQDLRRRGFFAVRIGIRLALSLFVLGSIAVAAVSVHALWSRQTPPPTR